MVRFGDISGEFGWAMVRILARHSGVKPIPMARLNESDKPPKRARKVNIINMCCLMSRGRRRGGFMVSAHDSGSTGLGSRPDRGHCVVFLGKTLYSHSASLHPGV